MPIFILNQLLLVNFATQNHNIYIATDPTHLDVDHAAHAGWPTMCRPTQQVTTTHLL